jgi:hypothetical protein
MEPSFFLFSVLHPIDVVLHFSSTKLKVASVSKQLFPQLLYSSNAFLNKSKYI